ncbi:MAG: tRNA dimethylallyltransferase [Thermoleophilaceae bacterium]|nr:tRNA dimethylallyltransferase [Thermoleophilaceae bacterium]
MREVLALFGPTGVGKTAVALELADLLRERGEDPVAIGADALQVYEGLGVLTGAATPQEQETLEHRLVGVIPVTQKFDLGQYMPLAHAEVDAALAAGRRPIVVGGTGLYMRGALANLSLRKDEDELWSAETRHPTLLFGLTMDREALYERVDRRTEAIVSAGAESEVRAAAAASVTARKALGFDELRTGDVDALKKRSRNYARRQLTWMRKMAGLREIDATGRAPRDVAEEVLRILAAEAP